MERKKSKLGDFSLSRSNFSCLLLCFFLSFQNKQPSHLSGEKVDSSPRAFSLPLSLCKWCRIYSLLWPMLFLLSFSSFVHSLLLCAAWRSVSFKSKWPITRTRSKNKWQQVAFHWCTVFSFFNILFQYMKNCLLVRLFLLFPFLFLLQFSFSLLSHNALPQWSVMSLFWALFVSSPRCRHHLYVKGKDNTTKKEKHFIEMYCEPRFTWFRYSSLQLSPRSGRQRILLNYLQAIHVIFNSSPCLHQFGSPIHFFSSNFIHRVTFFPFFLADCLYWWIHFCQMKPLASSHLDMQQAFPRVSPLLFARLSTDEIVHPVTRLKWAVSPLIE